MVQRHSLESRPFGCRVKAIQKLLPRFLSQKRLNSLARGTPQVTLRFPLSTAAEADIAMHTATNGDTTLASSDGAWPLGNGPISCEMRFKVSQVA
jgi:hypothetical protein